MTAAQPDVPHRAVASISTNADSCCWLKEERHVIVPAGYNVSSTLRDEVPNGDFHGISWALVVSAIHIEKDPTQITARQCA